MTDGPSTRRHEATNGARGTGRDTATTRANVIPNAVSDISPAPGPLATFTTAFGRTTCSVLHRATGLPPAAASFPASPATR